jgi:Ca-activated chloride channel family protein
MPFAIEQPHAIHWLWAVLAAALLVWFATARRRRAAQRWADHPLFVRIAPTFSLARPLLRGALATLAMAALAAALLDPRLGSIEAPIERKGVDVVFVVDVSRSMLAEDATPNRLGRAKQLIRDAFERMAGDRVGLVAFAGQPSLQSPLTLNDDMFLMALDELGPRDSARGGSMLGDAIRTAAAAFTDEVKGGKAIVVLTDGEDMDSFPVEAARKAFDEKGIRTYTIGLGNAADGARIPVRTDGKRTWLVHEGQEVWSKMNPTLLTEIALAGGGAFIPAGTSVVDMGTVYDATVAAVGRRDYGTVTAKRPFPQFQWLVGVALALLVAEACLPNRRAQLRTQRSRPNAVIAGSQGATT